jgi:tetratricopeptide (TPR) repeat protein
VVKALARSGQFEQALEVAAERIENAYEAVRRRIAEVALALAQAGQIEQAQEAFQQALAAAERIEDADWRSRAYRAVALALAKEGDTARAIETLKRALEAANEIRNPSSRYSTVWGIARVAAEIGAGEVAQQLVVYELPVGRGRNLPAIMDAS